jgi:hypothetical protein
LGDQTDFRTATTFSDSIFAGEAERIAGAVSYKGGLILFKYPESTYFYATSDSDSSKWHPDKIAGPGAGGPLVFSAVEDDLLWTDPQGGWHILSATQSLGSVKASDIAYRKLGRYISENISLAVSQSQQMVYYSDKGEVMLACHGLGGSVKNRRLHVDLNRKLDQGERWIWCDRDVNEALYMRKINNVLIPHMVDDVGQIWTLDTVTRDKNSAGYTFEWFLADTDFSPIQPNWRGRKKNLRFIQIEYYPRTATSHTLEIYSDGVLTQTITLNLTSTGAVLGTPGALMPFFMGGGAMAITIRRRLETLCNRFAD